MTPRRIGIDPGSSTPYSIVSDSFVYSIVPENRFDPFFTHHNPDFPCQLK